jgi:hypothetical protein
VKKEETEEEERGRFRVRRRGKGREGEKPVRRDSEGRGRRSSDIYEEILVPP